MNKNELSNLMESAISVINSADLTKDQLQTFFEEKKETASEEFASAVYHIAQNSAHTFHYVAANEADFEKFEQELQYAIADMAKALIADYFLRNGVYKK